MNFEHDRTGESSSANYRGFTVKAHIEQGASNPWEDWDCNPPLAVWSGGRNGSGLTEHGDALDPWGDMPDSWFSRHWRAIAKALDLDPADHDREAREARKQYNAGTPLGAIRRDLFVDALAGMVPDRYGGNGGDYLTAVAALWGIRGVPALDSSSSGYSQGDYADVMAVATPAWAARVGCPPDRQAEALAYAVKLWGFWAWGDVYYWEIISPDGDSLDLCGGYYGPDHEESGLAEAARESIDSIISRAAKKRGAKLKELIRNRVPLYLRPALLDSAYAFEGNY